MRATYDCSTADSRAEIRAASAEIVDCAGPTRFYPRSHLSDTSPEQNSEEGEPAIVAAGDCVIFRSDVWHSADANVSDQSRLIMQCHFASDAVSGRIEPYVAPEIRTAVLDAATPRQRKLIRRWMDPHA